jgi:hypothetical protein
LRIAQAITKTEEEAAHQMMSHLHARFCPNRPPALATDGKGAYREAMLETWGEVPVYDGVGRPPTRKQPASDWQYVKVVKARVGSRLVGVSVQVVYGDPNTTLAQIGGHTAYVERTNLTTRQMNGRLVRKTLSFSKQVRALRDACVWEDWVYNLTRPLKTLRHPVLSERRKWLPCSPAMAAGLTNHIWTIQELLTTLVVPKGINSE